MLVFVVCGVNLSLLDTHARTRTRTRTHTHTSHLMVSSKCCRAGQMVEGRPTAHLCRVDLSDEIHEEMLIIEECSSKESFPPWDKKEWRNVQSLEF